MAAAADAKSAPTTVLVTGVTGFLGAHCAKLLVQKGYKVRGTVRNVQKERDALEKLFGGPDKIQLHQLDLASSPATAWREAAKGCKYCLHVASPYFSGVPKDPENEMIKPAVEGTTAALEACVAEGVERVVVTSSLASVLGGKDLTKMEFLTADMWTDLENAPAYHRSKTMAELKAWEYKDKIGVATVNPGGIFGPLLLNKGCESADQIKSIANMKRVPAGLGLQAVDVRDVAKVHVAALEMPNGMGERYLLGLPMTYAETVAAAKSGWTGEEVKVEDVGRIPLWVLRIAAWFSKSAATAIELEGFNTIKMQNDNIKEKLDLELASPSKAIHDMAKSMVGWGMNK